MPILIADHIRISFVRSDEHQQLNRVMGMVAQVFNL